MRRQPLGRTRFSASVLGIGDLADRAVPLADCVATIHRALDYGLNLVDTAPMYEDGYSEEIVERYQPPNHRGQGAVLVEPDRVTV